MVLMTVRVTIRYTSDRATQALERALELADLRDVRGEEHVHRARLREASHPGHYRVGNAGHSTKVHAAAIHHHPPAAGGARGQWSGDQRGHEHSVRSYTQESN